MGNSRNQLIIAIVFALLLGLIIVIAARCSSGSSTLPARTATPKTTAVKSATPKTSVTPGIPGSATNIPGRATDVSIVPPGTQPSPVSTQISVGPLPGTTPLPAATIAAPTAVVLRPTAVPQVAAPLATVAIPAGGIIYTVKAGDSLSTIARTYGTTTALIAQANGITNVSIIRVGQKLRIPGVTTATTGTTTTGRVYVVQAGDTLGKIAIKYGVTVDAIVKANNLPNSNLIRVGQKLTIP